MTAIVHIEPGQWVLAYVAHFGPHPYDETVHDALERLRWRGSGWDCLSEASEQFELLQVERVMPKTFATKGGERRPRNLVIASASTPDELLALRDKLFMIGFAADRAIEEETSRVMADFIENIRADALAQVHAALPHIFGRDA